MDLKDYFRDNYEVLEESHPFTDKEREKYTKNDRDFIRYMQIVFNSTKESAIKKFEIYKADLITKKQERIEFQKQISDMYEGMLLYRNAPNPRKAFTDTAFKGQVEFIKKFEIKPTKYAGALGGIPKSKSAEKRFTLLDKKSRRYLDNETGLEVSRRARDMIVKEISIEEYARKQRL